MTFTWDEGLHGKREASGYTRDVSEHGLFVVADARISPSAKLLLEINFSHLNSKFPTHMTANGRVLRVEKSSQGEEVQGFAAAMSSLVFAKNNCVTDTAAFVVLSGRRNS